MIEIKKKEITMEEKKYEVANLKQNALSTAKELLKDSAEVMTNKLSEYFGKNALFAVEVCKNMMEITKDSIKVKDEAQKKYVQMCDDVIKSCNKALDDGNVTDEEKIIIRDTIKEVMIRLDESNKRYQKDKKEIIVTGFKTAGVVASLFGVAAIIANAITKSLKK